MKTLAYICMLLGFACLMMGLAAIHIYHDYRPFIHSAGSAFLACMMYFSITDKGEPDGKA